MSLRTICNAAVVVSAGHRDYTCTAPAEHVAPALHLRLQQVSAKIA
jgi:hypothetical protein